MRIVLNIVAGMRELRRRLLLSAPVLLLVAGACGAEGDGEGDGTATIVATTSILGDVVESIVGDDARVDVLIPAGVDPHAFEPSAREAAQLRDATLVVANGLGLEAGLGPALDAARDDGVEVLEVAPLVDPLPFGAAHVHGDEDDGGDDDHHGDDGDHGDLDPHVWHDPLRMAAAVPAIVDALVSADPALDAAALAERADALVADLEAVDAGVVEVLEVVPPERRFLVTSHDTFGYFADRYGFEVVGVVIPGGDTLASPSAADLADLVEEVVDHDLPAVFAENVGSTALSETLAAEAGREVAVVSLFTDALGEPGSGAETYLGMLRTNAGLVADALG